MTAVTSLCGADRPRDYSGGKEEDRLYVLKLDSTTGALSLGEAFHDTDKTDENSNMWRLLKHQSLTRRLGT